MMISWSSSRGTTPPACLKLAQPMIWTLAPNFVLGGGKKHFKSKEKGQKDI
jgi:alkaline phosphatase